MNLKIHNLKIEELSRIINSKKNDNNITNYK